MNSVPSKTPEEEEKSYRFVLKLWLVTNDPSDSCMKWNRDQTILIANIYELLQMFFAGSSTILGCKTIQNFFWMMYIHGFETCDRDVLAESERNEIPDECMLFTHPQFRGCNAEIFEAWLSNHAVRVHASELKGSCTLPPQMHFMFRENIVEFDELRMQVLAVMMHLETKLRQPLRSEENASIEIPAPYVDYQVMDEPDYCKTKEIEGNYGPVSVSELKKCLGNLLPIAHNDIANEYAANEIDVVEELQLVEDNEASEVDNATFVVQEPAEMTMQPSLYMEFDDVRELYASADLWTINEIQEDMVEEVEVGSENDTESLPLVPLQASEIEQILNENMPQYLTNSVQACLPAIDFE